MNSRDFKRLTKQVATVPSFSGLIGYNTCISSPKEVIHVIHCQLVTVDHNAVIVWCSIIVQPGVCEVGTSIWLTCKCDVFSWVRYLMNVWSNLNSVKWRDWGKMVTKFNSNKHNQLSHILLLDGVFHWIQYSIQLATFLKCKYLACVRLHFRLFYQQLTMDSITMSWFLVASCLMYQTVDDLFKHFVN